MQPLLLTCRVKHSLSVCWFNPLLSKLKQVSKLLLYDIYGNNAETENNFDFIQYTSETPKL